MLRVFSKRKYLVIFKIILLFYIIIILFRGTKKTGCIIFGVGEGILSETEIAHLK